MASEALSLGENIKSITECCICVETFKNPRMLSCIHTFCYLCLEKTVEKFKAGDKVPCPLCRQEFVIPADGLSAIPKNFFMERLVEMTEISRFSDEKLCDPCREIVITPLAKAYCIECQESLCENCSIYHKKLKQTKDHQIVVIGTKTCTEELLKKAAPTNCGQHKDKSIEMFCEDCSEAICMKCFALSHQTHKMFEISSVAGKFREELKGYANTIHCEDGFQVRNQLAKSRSDFIEEVGNTEAEINKAANELIDLVKKHRDNLLSELNSEKMKVLKKNENSKDELDRQLTILENFKTYCTEMENKGSDGDICRSMKDLRVRFREIQELSESISRQQVSMNSIKFTKNDSVTVSVSGNNIVGSIISAEKIEKENEIKNIGQPLEATHPNKCRNEFLRSCMERQRRAREAHLRHQKQ